MTPPPSSGPAAPGPARPWARAPRPPALDPALHGRGCGRSQAGTGPGTLILLTAALGPRLESLRQGRVPTAALRGRAWGGGPGRPGLGWGQRRSAESRGPSIPPSAALHLLAGDRSTGGPSDPILMGRDRSRRPYWSRAKASWKASRASSIPPAATRRQTDPRSDPQTQSSPGQIKE